MSIIGLVRNCPICNKPVMGKLLHANNMVYHEICYINKTIRDKYIAERSNYEHLLATLYYEGYEVME